MAKCKSLIGTQENPLNRYTPQMLDLSEKTIALAIDGHNIVERAASDALCPLSQENAEKAVTMFGILEGGRYDPLSRAEFIVLACALHVMSNERRRLDAADVLVLTGKFQGRAMSVGQVYPTLNKLTERGLVKKAEGDLSKSGREAATYKITDLGVQQFKLALMNTMPVPVAEPEMV